MKKFLVLLFFSTLFFITDEAYATFEDGKNTITYNNEPVLFYVKVKAGDVIEIDYTSSSKYNNLYIRDLEGVILKSFLSRNGPTFSYSFEQDYDGFLLVSGNDKSIVSRIYEVRLNNKMIFDGQSVVVELEELSEAFVSVTPLYDKATFKFDVEMLDREVKEIFLYNADGVVINSFTDTTYTVNNLVPGTEYKYFVSVDFGNGQVTKKQQVVFMTKAIPKIDDSVVVSDVTTKSAKLNFNFGNVVPEKIKVYDSNSNLYAEYENYTANTSKVINGLEQNTEYKFYVSAVFSGFESEKKAISFTTLEASPEIANLTAKAKYNRVDLSWELPERNDFEYVTIYRKENQAALFSLFSVGEEYDPLFETNGTYFNDLTVEPETSYTYLLTSFLTSGEETKGVSVDVETPPVAMVGDDIEQDENEDYVITWTDPTTGKILVSVGGEEYAIVNASDLKIIIPKEDMKLNGVGLPDVVLTPLDENGVPIGKPSKPDGSDMGSIIGGIDLSEGFKANNLLLIAVGLLGLVVMFVLLGLGFRVVPKLINTITVAIKGGKSV